MSKNTNQSVQNSDAVFPGWGKTPPGTTVILHNITAVTHPSYGSTVSEETLRELHLKIPPIPARQIGANMRRFSFIAQ